VGWWLVVLVVIFGCFVVCCVVFKLWVFTYLVYHTTKSQKVFGFGCFWFGLAFFLKKMFPASVVGLFIVWVAFDQLGWFGLFGLLGFNFLVCWWFVGGLFVWVFWLLNSGISWCVFVINLACLYPCNHLLINF
jgi:hypothetical protein